MADVHEPEVRSYNMSRVKSKNTRPEILIRKFLFSKGFRFRIHVNRLPGKPDIVLPKYKTVIFVNGCFWHQHDNCKRAQIPYTNKDFWTKKLEENKQRDANTKRLLTNLGWKVIFFWECELKLFNNPDLLKLIDKKNNDSIE